MGDPPPSPLSRERAHGTGTSVSFVAVLKARAPFEISWNTRETIGAGALMPPAWWRVVIARLEDAAGECRESPMKTAEEEDKGMGWVGGWAGGWLVRVCW